MASCSSRRYQSCTCMGRQGDPESVEATQLPKGTRDIALQWRPAGPGMHGVGYHVRLHFRLSSTQVVALISTSKTFSLIPLFVTTTASTHSAYSAFEPPHVPKPLDFDCQCLVSMSLSSGPQYSRTKALNDTIRGHIWTQSPIPILN